MTAPRVPAKRAGAPSFPVRSGNASTDSVTRPAPKPSRARLARWRRTLGITLYGAIAFVGFIGLWVMARVVAGKSMYVFAYGLLLLLVLSFFISPKLRLTGERAGLFPRATQGDRLEVNLKLVAKRRASTFILEERVPDRLGSTVKVPITRLPSGQEIEHSYSIRCTRRGVYQVGPLVAVASDPLGLRRARDGGGRTVRTARPPQGRARL